MTVGIVGIDWQLGTLSDPLIPNPVLVLESASDSGASSSDNITNNTTPTIDMQLGTPAIAGDVITVIDNGAPVFTHALTAAEISAGVVSMRLGSMSQGAHPLKANHKRGAHNLWTGTVVTTITVDTTAPVLTSPAGAALANTTATLSVFTNEGGGTLYWVVTSSATLPSTAQMKAGQDNTGAAAFSAGSQAVAGTGAQNVTATGLVLAGTRFAHFMHEDVAGNDSAVDASPSWAQAGGGAVTVNIAGTSYGTSTGGSTSLNYTGMGNVQGDGLIFLVASSRQNLAGQFTAVWDSAGLNGSPQTITTQFGQNTTGSANSGGAVYALALRAPNKGSGSNLALSWSGGSEMRVVGVSLLGINQTSDAIAFPSAGRVGAQGTSAVGSIAVPSGVNHLTLAGWVVNDSVVSVDHTPVGPNSGVVNTGTFIGAAFNTMSGAAPNSVIGSTMTAAGDVWAGQAIDVVGN